MVSSWMNCLKYDGRKYSSVKVQKLNLHEIYVCCKTRFFIAYLLLCDLLWTGAGVFENVMQHSTDSPAKYTGPRTTFAVTSIIVSFLTIPEASCFCHFISRAIFLFFFNYSPVLYTAHNSREQIPIVTMTIMTTMTIITIDEWQQIHSHYAHYYYYYCPYWPLPPTTLDRPQ